MVAAASAYIARRPGTHVLLVGYSGGGAIAALMAPAVPHLLGVVTIAGNLDPDAWTALHGYLPLAGSLNPALQPPLDRALEQWHLVGGRDTNVPYRVVRHYLERVPPERVWRYDTFDHSCCWVQQWPRTFDRIRAQLKGRPTAAVFDRPSARTAAGAPPAK